MHRVKKIKTSTRVKELKKYVRAKKKYRVKKINKHRVLVNTTINLCRYVCLYVSSLLIYNIIFIIPSSTHSSVCVCIHALT